MDDIIQIIRTSSTVYSLIARLISNTTRIDITKYNSFVKNNDQRTERLNEIDALIKLTKIVEPEDFSIFKEGILKLFQICFACPMKRVNTSGKLWIKIATDWNGWC